MGRGALYRLKGCAETLLWVGEGLLGSRLGEALLGLSQRISGMCAEGLSRTAQWQCEPEMPSV